MAITLPTARLVIPTSNFLRSRPVLSGDGANSHTFGHRGLVSQVNHALAYKTRSFGGSSHYDGSTIATDNTGSWVAVTGYLRFYVGANIAKLRLYADVEDCSVRLETSQGNSAGTSTGAGTRALITEDFTLSSSGVVIRARIQIQSITTAKLYPSKMVEVPMVAGDFP